MAEIDGSGPSTASSRQPASELLLRVVSSLVLGAAALAVSVAGGWPFALFWLAAGVAIGFEWLAMTKVEPHAPLRLVLGGTLAIAALVAFAGGHGLIALAAWGGGMIGIVAFGRHARDRCWGGVGLAYAAVIAVVPPVVREDPRLGLVAILWMFAVVWTTDIAAYFTGRRFGGPKLWQQISPKKTWSGFAGGLIAGTFAGVAVALIAGRAGWPPPLGLAGVLLLSAAASILSQFGDLAESALKRRFGAKDSGWLIPGHGGVMDRLDGFWAVAALLGVVLAGAQTLRSPWGAPG